MTRSKERTLDDLRHDFGTGTRVRDKYFNTRGVILCRGSGGAWVLWDNKDEPLHAGDGQLAELTVEPQDTSMLAREASIRRVAAMDCDSAVAPKVHIDPFDTGSLKGLGGD